ncbi:Nucleolar protein 58 [Acipenser ruthenus]|uniref:Nucleolar protein 58 n=1 Tax=Acipenser ruthenus TaxID=7906 RepID=A0A444UAA2_ACIRT|nr:Nucleolar protein 58 [Acipenser ruthenus]
MESGPTPQRLRLSSGCQSRRHQPPPEGLGPPAVPHSPYHSAIQASTSRNPALLMVGKELQTPAEMLFGRPPGTETLPSGPEYATDSLQAAGLKQKHKYKVLDEKKLQEVDSLWKQFETPEKANKIVKLKHFEKFQDTTEALAAATALVEGKIGKSLKKVLKKVVAKEAHEQLAISDAKLGGVIKDKLNLSCVHNTAIAELMRGIRNQMESLITGLPPREISAMSLGLAHSLSRYKLKFSPDKVDTMIVQAISLLDDLDKELNNYIMRCREWYGWHFPEIGKIITDNLAYCKSVKKIGVRTNVATTDLSDILPEEVEGEVKTAAEISMGTEVSEEDIGNILHLCDQVIEISEYRAQLYDYLKNRMMAIAPNLTVMVGELVGARLIAHAGSLLNLAKHPASTVQILGAEKALFRALKTKRDTPKYGLIYHASLVGQTTPKNKGKISRMLAAKAALAIRYDALGEDTNTELGVESRAKLEVRLRHLEEKGIRRISGTGKAMAKTEKYQHKSEVKTYDPSGDSTLPSVSKKRKLEEAEEPTEVKVKKMKKERIPEAVEEEEEEAAAEEPPKKKKKKHEPAEEEEPAAVEEPSEKKKKKKKKAKEEEDE